MRVRIEKDTLGKKKVPAQAYWGVQTQRALENFPVSGLVAHPRFVEATVHIKRAAAVVNCCLGLLSPRKARAIIRAADEILRGRLRDQFVVDVFQAGAGTSHNMNVNEVIANRAIEILGGKRGDYKLVHPHDDVNMAQSTNDVEPTAIRLAALFLLREFLLVLEKLERSFAKKARQFYPIVKSGRTHLQDATPVRLGQEFGAYAQSISNHRRCLRQAMTEIQELGLGGTAVGTGLNAHPRYRGMVIRQLSQRTGFPLRPARDPFEAMQSLAPLVAVSGAIRNLAVDLIRIANDLRLLSSGPCVGLGEIQLPAVQPGSSIMPGKVNPVMAEMLDMVCFQVIGNDTAVSLAAQAGQLELNVMMPLVAFSLLQSLEILKNATDVFTTRCVNGIAADRERCRRYGENSMAMVTALSPLIGYEKAAEVAKEALASGRPIRQVALEKGFLTEKQLQCILKLEKLTAPGIPGRV